MSMNIQPCFNLKLRQADRVLTAYYNSFLGELGLKITQFSVLRSLWYMKSTSQKELEKVLLVDQATLTRSLQPLIRQGYIDRVPDANDRRVMMCSLSSSGKALYKDAEKRWKQAQKSVEEKLGKETMTQLINASEALIGIKSLVSEEQ